MESIKAVSNDIFPTVVVVVEEEKEEDSALPDDEEDDELWALGGMPTGRCVGLALM